MSGLELFGRRSGGVARPSGALGLCLVLLYGCGGDGVTGSPDAAQSSGLRPSVVKVPLELIDTAFVPCAGDNGESVELDVREQIVTHESTDSQGTNPRSLHHQRQGNDGHGAYNRCPVSPVGRRKNDRSSSARWWSASPTP